MAYQYETVTISNLDAVPVTGHAKVFVRESAGKILVPTLETILSISKATKYIIGISDLKIDADVSNPMSILPDTEPVEITVNDTIYKDCRRMGGSLKSVNLIKGSTIFNGTVLYTGYLWPGVEE